jgi:hypothetical protein
LFAGRILRGKPVSTFPENAPEARDRSRAVPGKMTAARLFDKIDNQERAVLQDKQ